MNKVSQDSSVTNSKKIHIMACNKSDTTLDDVFIKLNNFLSVIIDENGIISKYEKKANQSYHHSIFHFLLYYFSVGNPAFVMIIGNSVFYGSIVGKKLPYLQISCPIYQTELDLVDDLYYLLNSLEYKLIVKGLSIDSILVRDVNQKVLNIIKHHKKTKDFLLKNIKEIRYRRYNIQEALLQKGVKYANIRWHINKFNNSSHKVKVIETLSNETPLFHLIGKWRREAIKNRGFSYSNVESDKYCVKCLLTIVKQQSKQSFHNLPFYNTNKIFYRILKVDNKISSFHCGFPIGYTTSSQYIAHVVGLSDLSIPHLSEYAQIDFWNYLSLSGYRFVNDGPSWRKSLEMYKDKYRPMNINNLYWITLKQNK